MINYRQETSPKLAEEDGLGWCLRQTQSVFSAPVKYATAREAWDNQVGRHAGEMPPKGVSVPIWLDHWGSYGRPAKWGNFGHAATSLPDGRVLTSPLLNRHLKRWDPTKGEMVGSAIYPSIQALQKDIGGNPKYLGWSEFMNGKQIVSPINNPSGGDEDEEMATRPIGHYIGGGKETPAVDRKWVIYYPDSGLYMYIGGTDQSYINEQAQVHGTKPFTFITPWHWEDQLRPHLDAMIGLRK